MGKIGDLIVRLQLKHEDYKKGLKQAEKDTKGFGANLNKGIGAIKAAWAAVGVAVIAAAKTMITEMSKASNRVGDLMAVLSKQVGAVWQTMITSITAGFDNFLARAESSAKAAKALQEMEDAEYEMLNSVKLKRAELEQQLIKWEIESKDATKSYADRQRAAEKYLEAVKDIYGIEMKYYKDLAKQSMATWLQSASTPKGSILGYSEANAKALYKFLKEYGSDTGLQDAIKNYRTAWDEAGELWNRTEAGKNALRWVNENRQDMGQTNYRRFALDLGWAYEEQKNDELNGTKLVDIIEKYLNAVSAYDTETKKMQNNLNSLTAQVEKGTDLDLSEETEQVNYLAESLERLNGINGPAAAAMTIPDIIPDDWLTRNRAKIDEALAEAMRLQGITEDINMMFENAVAGSLSGATQALTDAIAGIEGADASQVLAALLQPFASTMTQMGEMLIVEGAGIKAFKESLKSLNPAVAIGAGAALIALGAALSSGIQALGSSAGSSATTASSSAVASSSVSGKEFKSEQTIYVKGKISGADILIAGDNQRNKWSR
jgi:hypothetical protein